MAKVDRNGRAATLSDDELEALLEAAPSPRYRCLWAIQRWTAGRIGESLALRWGDLNGVVTYRKATTKTKATRQVPTAPRLTEEIEAYRKAWAQEHGHTPSKEEVLFPALGSTTTPQSRQAADKALRQTCARLGLEGVSTHSFRRSLFSGSLATRAWDPWATIWKQTKARCWPPSQAAETTENALPTGQGQAGIIP